MTTATSEMTAADTAQGAYTLPELAARVNVSVKSVNKWHQKHRIPGLIRCGRVIRYDRNAIEKRLLSGSLLLPVDNEG